MATRCLDRFLVVDDDARVVGGPMGPLVVTLERGRELIDEQAGERGGARELAPVSAWVASWGPVPEGGAAWKLVHRDWRTK